MIFNPNKWISAKKTVLGQRKENLMKLDGQVNQGVMLNNVQDIQMRQGICYALSTEWCLCMQKNKNFDFNSVFYRMVSRQRAYNLTFADKIKNMTQGNKYQLFFNTAEPPSFKFMQDQAKHEGVTTVRQLVPPSEIEDKLSKAIKSGESCILGFFGVDSNQNWGHATAVGLRDIAGSKPRFFDPNQGQYSWPKDTNTTKIARDIMQNINMFYGLNTIRNFVIYGLS